jgi:hypothetical protein
MAAGSSDLEVSVAVRKTTRSSNPFPATMIRQFITLLALACGSGYCLSAAAKPNILFILADDIGYGDVRILNPSRGEIPPPIWMDWRHRA